MGNVHPFPRRPDPLPLMVHEAVAAHLARKMGTEPRNHALQATADRFPPLATPEPYIQRGWKYMTLREWAGLAFAAMVAMGVGGSLVLMTVVAGQWLAGWLL